MPILVSERGPGTSDEAKLKEELRFRARMTEYQFRALAMKVNHRQLVDELSTCRFWRNPARGRLADDNVIERWLRNGWNTERLLRATTKLLGEDELSSALQWSFPQAYYSAFAVTLAFFHARGFTETKHRSVIEGFGNHISEGRYPASMSFAVYGQAEALTYRGIARPEGYRSIDFSVDDLRSVDNQICQFLKATHELALEDRRHDMRNEFKTLMGRPKKRLAQADWQKVADSTGWTTILSLLYRKRIKANYGDVETFIAEEIDSAQVHRDLVHIVSGLNFTHEALLSRSIGLPLYSGMVERFLDDGQPASLARRLDVVRRLGAL